MTAPTLPRQAGTLALSGRVSGVLVRRGYPVAPPPRWIIDRYTGWRPHVGYRVIAQDVKTGEFYDWDVPLSDVEVTYTLSGPGTITGKLSPEIPALNLDALNAWATWLHVEQDGAIRASGILQPVSLDDVTLTIEAEGPSGYAHGLPFDATMSRIGADPLDIARDIWAHVQAQPDGNLGLQVDSVTKTPVRLGTEKKDVEFTTSAGEDVSFEAGPYTLNWWDHKDCGDEVNSLAKNTPFDYIETATWNPAKTDVEHHLVFGYPRLGRRLQDVSFVLGDNVTDPIPLVEGDDTYASVVIALGSGEGAKMVRGVASQRDPARLRRVAVVQDKNLDSKTKAEALARDELLRRQARVSMQKVTVDLTKTPHGTWTVGDDVPVVGRFPYVGDVTIWHRITGAAIKHESDTADVDLVPSDSLRYGPPLEGQ